MNERIDSKDKDEKGTLVILIQKKEWEMLALTLTEAKRVKKKKGQKITTQKKGRGNIAQIGYRSHVHTNGRASFQTHNYVQGYLRMIQLHELTYKNKTSKEERKEGDAFRKKLRQFILNEQD